MPVENGGTSESPPVAETPVAQAAAPAAAVANSDVKADSSTAKDESLMDRVTAALKPKTEGSSPSTASQTASPNPEPSSEDDDKEPESDPTEEEQARYHSKTRKQIRRLLNQRNEALDKVKTLEPEAEGFRKVTSFIRESGMSADEANLLLEVGRNMKQDPHKAWEQLQPYIAALRRIVGEVLPDDLQAAVTKGEISEAYARQLAGTRSKTEVLTQRTQAQEEAERNRRAADQQRQHGDAVGQTISTWESNQAKTDPDWSLKQARIGELIELDVRRNGYPKTAQAAIDMAEKAKTAVNADLARFQPRRAAVTPIEHASSARPAPAKPRNAYEAADMALAAARG